MSSGLGLVYLTRCELICEGLAPAIFHANKEDLLAEPPEDLPDFVDTLVRQSKKVDVNGSFATLRLSDCESSIYTSVPGPSSRLALDIGPSITSNGEPWRYRDSSSASGMHFIRVVMVEKPAKDLPYILSSGQGRRDEAVMALPDPKTDPKPYFHAIGTLVDYVERLLAQQGESGIILRPGRRIDVDSAIRIYRADLSAQIAEPLRDDSFLSPHELVDARKVIIPLALVLLCAIPELASLDSTTSSSPAMTKADIASQLYGLVALWPNGNPPRAALKRVNEYLMREGKG